MKVFLSWSGQKSERVALALKNWLPNVIQDISEEDIFVSSEDIDKGSNWNIELVKELENDNFGILCITKENVVAPWIMFEAGALSKFSQEARVCPFLFDLTKREIKSNPLSQFQITEFEKTDVLKLLKSLNKKIDKPLLETKLTASFEKFYTELEKALNEIKVPVQAETRAYCPFHAELENGKLKIEQELENIKRKSGLIEVFENQSCAVRDFEKKHKDLKIETTKILCIRGDNFVKEGKENWSSIIPANSYEITILGNPDDENMIKNRYEAQKLRNDETIEMFNQRYGSEMRRTQDILKTYQNNTVYLHNESDLPFRMIFIGDYLFLSTFDKSIAASEVGVLKIYKSSTLYSVCEEYFNKIKSNLVPYNETNE